MTAYTAFEDRPQRRGIKRYKARRRQTDSGVYMGKPPASEGLLEHSSRLMVERARLEADLETAREKLRHLEAENQEPRGMHDRPSMWRRSLRGGGWRLSLRPPGRYLVYLLGTLLFATGATLLAGPPIATALAGVGGGFVAPLSWALLIVGLLVLSINYFIDHTSRQR